MISPSTLPAMTCRLASQRRSSKYWAASAIGNAATSAIFLPAMRTARLCFLRRAPLHPLQVVVSLAPEEFLVFRVAFSRIPNPPHNGQAPLGLLNENRLGTSSGKELPHWAQANFWLKRNSLIG